MTPPRVLCVMLAAGRQEMVERAVRCYLAQSYDNKALAILDNGPEPLTLPLPGPSTFITRLDQSDRKRSIGELRNIANATASLFQAEVIAHFDSDDFSHSERISEQVMMLMETGADAVGYSEMLFWDTKTTHKEVWKRNEPGQVVTYLEPIDGVAWLYSSPNPNACLGTSLMYKRATWERHPFPHKHHGEDTQWCLKLKTRAASAGVAIPRMIASIHGENTCSEIKPGAKEWRRVAEYDQVCREAMKL